MWKLKNPHFVNTYGLWRITCRPNCNKNVENLQSVGKLQFFASPNFSTHDAAAQVKKIPLATFSRCLRSEISVAISMLSRLDAIINR